MWDFLSPLNSCGLSGRLAERTGNYFESDLVLLSVTTLTYASSSSPLTRPRSSGTLSREGRGL